jgi:hypothetical protein
MTNGGTTLGCIAGVFALWAAANTLAVEASGSPYQGIVDRNVFGLKPPPPPPPGPEEMKPPPPNIKLQGITTILGKKLVLMKVMMPPKPGVKPEEQSFNLVEGQREGDIEVLQIDEVNKTVKVNNFGTITNLNFKDNGVVIASGPAPGPPVPGAPGAPRLPGVGVPPPPATPTFTPAAGGYQPRSIPTTRTPRMGNPPGAAAYSPAYGGASPASVYTAVPTPQTYGAVPITTPTTTPISATPGTVALSGLGAPASTFKPQQNWPPETRRLRSKRRSWRQPIR